MERLREDDTFNATKNACVGGSIQAYIFFLPKQISNMLATYSQGRRWKFHTFM
jgi:hypothetical protein